MANLPTDFLVFSYAYNKHFHDVARATEENNLEMLYECIWRKQNFTFILGRYIHHRYQPEHEPILFFRRKGTSAGVFNVPPDQGTVFDVPKAAANKEHPTIKPLELWVQLMRYHSNIGDSVYDPFLGSGTTLMAAEKLGRTCMGIEIEPRYVDVAVKRWEQYTGRKGARL
jgi:DNA modification methylase